MTSPTVSIIMPVYNGAAFLEKTLTETLRQPFQDFEIICVDDSSTDNSLEILKAFEGKDPRIRVFHRAAAETHGAGPTRNRALLEARGALITFLDQDDLLESFFLLTAVEEARRQPLSDFIYFTRHRFMRPSDQNLSSSPSAPSSKFLVPHPWKIKHTNGDYTLLWENNIPKPARIQGVVFRKNLLDQNDIRFVNVPVFCDDGLFANITWRFARQVSIICQHAYIYHNEETISNEIYDYRDTPYSWLKQTKDNKKRVLSYLEAYTQWLDDGQRKGILDFCLRFPYHYSIAPLAHWIDDDQIYEKIQETLRPFWKELTGAYQQDTWGALSKKSRLYWRRLMQTPPCLRKILPKFWRLRVHLRNLLRRKKRL